MTYKVGSWAKILEYVITIAVSVTGFGWLRVNKSVEEELKNIGKYWQIYAEYLKQVDKYNDKKMKDGNKLKTK